MELLSCCTIGKIIFDIRIVKASAPALEIIDKNATTGVGELESNKKMKILFSRFKPCVKF